MTNWTERWLWSCVYARKIGEIDLTLKTPQVVVTPAQSRCRQLYGFKWERICCVRRAREKHTWHVCSLDEGFDDCGLYSSMKHYNSGCCGHSTKCIFLVLSMNLEGALQAEVCKLFFSPVMWSHWLLLQRKTILWGLWHFVTSSVLPLSYFPFIILTAYWLTGQRPEVLCDRCRLFTPLHPAMWWCLVTAKYRLTAWGEGVEECLSLCKCGSLSLKVNQHIFSGFITGLCLKHQTLWAHFCDPRIIYITTLLATASASHWYSTSPKDVLACFPGLCWTSHSVNKWQMGVMAARQIDHPGWGHSINLGQAFIGSRALSKHALK